MADPTQPSTRRALRVQRDDDARAVFARRRWTAGAIALAGVLAIVVPIGLAAGGRQAPAADDAAAPPIAIARASTLPVPPQIGAPTDTASAGADETGVDDTEADDTEADDTEAEQTDAPEPALCDQPGVRDALSRNADAEVIAAMGGAEAFRAAVADQTVPCVNLSEADRVWVVVNKQRGLEPIDYWPEPQARAEGVQRTSGGHMRADVAAALVQLAAAARAEGAGEIGVNSGFRSYEMQSSTYRGYVGQLGQEQADLTSARPGHSEHQTGLAVDVVACDPGCGGIESFAGTPQAQWVAAQAWRFGFIVRYGDGHTGTTGYEWEPWHLRYIGPDLAAAYNAGGYATLEEFFGLDAAPGYPD